MLHIHTHTKVHARRRIDKRKSIQKYAYCTTPECTQRAGASEEDEVEGQPDEEENESGPNEPDAELSEVIVDIEDGDITEWLKTPGLAGSTMIAHRQGAKDLKALAKRLYKLVLQQLTKLESSHGRTYKVYPFGSMSYGAGTMVSDLDIMINLF